MRKGENGDQYLKVREEAFGGVGVRAICEGSNICEKMFKEDLDFDFQFGP